MDTRTLYGTTLTLTLICPRTGNQLWHGANGVNYIRVASTGHWMRATMAAK